MSFKSFLSGLFLTSLASVSYAQTSQVQAQKTIAGHSVELTNASGGGVNVVVDGQVIESESDDMFDMIYGSYDVAGTPIVLIQHSDGGTACPATFSAIILGSSITATKEFGSCSDIPKVSASGDQLIVNTPSMTGQGSEVDIVTKDGLNATENVAEQLGGPDYASGMDLAATLIGKQPYAPFKLKATSEKIKSLVGNEVFSMITQFVIGSEDQPSALGNYVVDDLCMPHACSSMSTHLVFDHNGNAWVAVNNNGNWSWYGNPPADVIATLSSN